MIALFSISVNLLYYVYNHLINTFSFFFMIPNILIISCSIGVFVANKKSSQSNILLLMGFLSYHIVSIFLQLYVFRIM